MLAVDVTKAKTAELESELELYRSSLGEDAGDVPALVDLKNNKERGEAILVLRGKHGTPVLVDEAFVTGNPSLAKILMEGEDGAKLNEVVFAEGADFAQAEQLDAELAERTSLNDQLIAKGITLTEEEVMGLTTDELQAKLEAASKEKESDGALVNSAPGEGEPKKTPKKVDTSREMVYMGRSITRVQNAVVHGKLYKEIVCADGQTYRVTPEEFDKVVTNR